MTRHLFIALLAGLGWSLAMAAAPQEAWNQPYAEKTAALGLKGDIGRGELAFVICQGCHRVGALGRADGSYPRLAGQHVTVLIKQLTDVRSDRRSNPKMLPFADHQALSVQDIADIAAYLQALPAAADQGRGSGVDLARGSQLYERDCLVCHGRQGEGKADSFYPKVAGQHYIYLLREGSMIRDGKRSNAHPDMIDVVKKYSDADMDAVSDYMSRLPVHLH